MQSLDRLLQSDEAIVDWRILTDNGKRKPKEEELRVWYKKWVNIFQGMQQEMLINVMVKDYFERQAKFEEVGPEKYTAWIDEKQENNRKLFLEKYGEDALKAGSRKKDNDFKINVTDDMVKQKIEEDKMMTLLEKDLSKTNLTETVITTEKNVIS